MLYLKKWKSRSSVTVHGEKKKKQDSGGFRSALSVPLHSVQKKGFVWFRVLMRWDKGNQDMSRKQEQYVRETDPGSTGCLWMHLYTSLHNKRMYSHLYRGVGLYLFSHKEGTSFSIINYILLASMHTWQVHKGSRRYVYIYTLIHTVHTVRSTADILKGGRGTEWKSGSAKGDKGITKFREMSMKPEAFTLSSEIFMRPTEQICVNSTLTKRQTW